VPTGLLDRLAEFCDPVVGLGWEDVELAGLLRAAGHEVVDLRPVQMSYAYRNHARRMDRIHARRLASPTTAIRRQRWKRRGLRRSRFIEDVRNVADVLATSVPGGSNRIEASDASVLHDETNVADFVADLQDLGVAGVLSFTPYHDQDVLLLAAAVQAEVTAMVSVISFDNPTIRGRLPVLPDRVMVWNEPMADQIRRSHPRLPAASVEVVGAPQFDLHRRPELVMGELEWRSALGLPAAGAVILYGAGPHKLVPGEHHLVAVLDRAIEEGRIPDRPHLLVRRHPADPPSVWDAHADSFRHATVVAPWAASETPLRSWPTEDDLRMQMSSLAHCAAHVNVCSSMTVDGAMFDRPQIGPTFVPGISDLQLSFVRRFYDQEHWEPIARSGGLVTVGDEAELVDAVTDGLRHPGRWSAERAALLEGVLTWPDGGSSARLARSVEGCLDATLRRSDRT
jgi:hypothetical protein